MSLEEQHRVGKENYTSRKLAERRAQENDCIARPASESLTVVETSDMLTESLNNLDSLVMELHQFIFPDYGGEDCMEVQSYPNNVIARRQIEMNNGVRATREKVEEILGSLR